MLMLENTAAALLLLQINQPIFCDRQSAFRLTSQKIFLRNPLPRAGANFCNLLAFPEAQTTASMQ